MPLAHRLTSMRKLLIRSTPESDQDSEKIFESKWPKKRWHLLKQHATEDDLDYLLAPLAQRDTRFEHVLKWYRQIAEKFEADLMNEGFYLNTQDGSRLRFEDSESVSQCLKRLVHELELPRTGLQVCAVSATTGKFKEAYSFPYEIYLTVRQRDEEAGGVVHLILAGILRVVWATDKQEEDIIKLILSDPGIITRPWQPRLPSDALQTWRYLKAPRDSICTPLDISWQECFYLEWEWLCNVPNFDNDVDVYVYEPFKKYPTFDSLRLVTFSSALQDRRKTLAITSSSAVLDHLAKSNCFPNQFTPSPSSTDSQIVQLIRNVFEIIRSDTANFVATASSVIEDITLRGRKRPSGWKIQLLNHLQECHLQLAKKCEQNIDTLDLVTNAIPIPVHRDDFLTYQYLDDLQESRADLVFLVQELRALGESITARTTLIRQQMDLVAGYRNTIIGFLVALYVPISFAASIFGMNVSTSPGSTYWTSTNKIDPLTYTTFNDSTLQDARNAVSATNATYTITSTDEATNRVWTFSDFWATAVPLAFGTIVFPLVIGPIFRGSAQFARTHRGWWRIMVLFVALGVFVGLDYFGYAFFEAELAIGTLQAALITAISAWHLYAAFKLRRQTAMSFAWSFILVSEWVSFILLAYFTSIGHIGGQTLEAYYDHVPYEWEWSRKWEAKDLTATLALLMVPWILIFVLWIARPSWILSLSDYRRQRRRNIRAIT